MLVAWYEGLLHWYEFGVDNYSQMAKSWESYAHYHKHIPKKALHHITASYILVMPQFLYREKLQVLISRE